MNKMKTDILFPTHIWIEEEVDIDFSLLNEYVLNLQKNSVGNKLSNIGGWQSALFMEKQPVVTELFSIIERSVLEITESIEFPKLNLEGYWFNVNTYGHYNDVHDHFPSILSGVFYIDIPDINMGNIIFHRPSTPAKYFIMTGMRDVWPNIPMNDFTADKIGHPAITKNLMIFPSWISHSVERCESKLNRISMSFNYGLNYPENSLIVEP